MRALLPAIACVLLTGCVSTQRFAGDAAAFREELAAAYTGRSAVLRSAGSAPTLVHDIRVDAHSLRFTTAGRSGAVALRDVCSLTPRVGTSPADAGVALIGAGFFGFLLAASRADRTEGTWIGAGSITFLVVGAILTGRRTHRPPRPRYVFRSQPCNESPER